VFIRAKTIKGKNYYYLVENKRDGEKVKQTVIRYLGTTKPNTGIVANSLQRSA
jgi:hypothetical protein